MELIATWFPAAKLVGTLVILVSLFLLFKANHYRIASILAIVWSIFLYLAPAKIDKTNSKVVHHTKILKAKATIQ